MNRRFEVGDKVRVTLPDNGLSKKRKYTGCIVGLEKTGALLDTQEPLYIVLVDCRQLLRRVLQSWIEPI